MDKICKDCKYYELYGENNRYARCIHTKNAERLPSRNLVTGELIEGRYNQPPHVLRSFNFLEAIIERGCGKEGRWYVPIKTDDGYME